MKNKVILKVELRKNSEMDYSMWGIVESEITALRQEFDPESYYNYNGQYAEYYTFRGLEVLMYLLEKYKANKLIKYEALFFSPKHETSIYQLSDGRILVLNVISATFYKNINEFLSSNNYIKKLFKKKRIPKNDYPILRIEYLPDAKKVHYYEISPIEGELFSQYYKKIDDSIYPYKNFIRRRIFEMPEDQILELQTSTPKYFLYEKKDFLLLQDKRKIALEYSRIVRSGSLINGVVNPKMCGRNPYGEQFVEKSGEIAEELFLHIRLPKNLIPKDLGGIINIEKYVYQNLVTATFSDKLFLPILAFAGNMLVEKREEFSWKMQFDEVWQTWIPDVYNGEFMELNELILELLDPLSRKGSYNKFSHFMRMKL